MNWQGGVSIDPILLYYWPTDWPDFYVPLFFATGCDDSGTAPLVRKRGLFVVGRPLLARSRGSNMPKPPLASGRLETCPVSNVDGLWSENAIGISGKDISGTDSWPAPVIGSAGVSNCGFCRRKSCFCQYGFDIFVLCKYLPAGHSPIHSISRLDVVTVFQVCCVLVSASGSYQSLLYPRKRGLKLTDAKTSLLCYKNVPLVAIPLERLLP